jgi:hypothetical protein
MILRYKQFCVWPIVIYFFYSLFNTVESIFAGFGAIHLLVVVIRVVLFVSMILGFLSIIKALDSKILLYVLFIFLLLVINFLIYPVLPDRFNEYMRVFVLICFPLSIMVYFVDEEQLNKVLDLSGLIIGYVFLVIFLLYILGIARIDGYNTSIGYSVILPEMILLSNIKFKNGVLKFASVISLISFMLVVVLFGSRGPIVTIIAYIVYDSIRSLKYEQRKNRKALGWIALLFSLIFLVVFFSSIMSFVLSVADKFGMHSRTLRLFANDFSHLSGRENQYSMVISAIKEHPLLIRGIAGDTVVTGGIYSHNLILELLCEFGVVLGLIAVLIIVIRAIKSLFFVDYRENSLLVISLFGSIVPLMFSSTLWMNCIFWMWITCYIKTDFSRARVYDYSDDSDNSETILDKVDQLEQGD